MSIDKLGGDDEFDTTPFNNLSDYADAGFDAEVRCSTPDPTAYHDAASQYLEGTDRSLAELIPSRYGNFGTIVPRATRLGGSRGYNPNKPGVVIVDPHLKDKGLSYAVDLSKVNSAMVDSVMPDGNDMDLRVLASRTFAALERLAPGRGVSTVTGAASRQTARPAAKENRKVDEQTVAQSLKKAAKATSSAQATATGPVPVAPPDRKVLFEIDGFGQHEAFYHEAGRDGDFIILAYDLRYAGPKFMPQRTDNVLYLRVGDDDQVYEARSVGIRFRLGCYDVCVLLVDRPESHDGDDDET